MLAKEYCDRIGKQDKPVVVSHHMLAGLKEGQEKMSKSDPDSAIFMEDTREDVNRKLKKSFCPPAIVKGNPVLDYCKSIIFPAFGKMTISKKPENGGDVVYTSYEDLEEDFKTEKLHPGDLKPSVAAAINDLLQPVRDHFENDPYAKKLLETIKKW